MEDYLNFAKEITERAQEIALKYFGFEIERTWKEDNTPLTLADTEINTLVINRIKESYPEHSIYGEEESFLIKGSKYIWVCDPIDGTMGFSSGLPIFTFSLALVDQSNGQPILGVINDPVMRNMYWACKDGGAYLNGRKISVMNSNTLINTILNMGGSKSALGYDILSLLKISKEKKFTVFRLPSFIYGGIQVANGKFSGAVFYGSSGHDVAALKIITEEAGGKVTDLKGNERRYDQDGQGCAVSNGILHEEILNHIK